HGEMCIPNVKLAVDPDAEYYNLVDHDDDDKHFSQWMIDQQTSGNLSNCLYPGDSEHLMTEELITLTSKTQSLSIAPATHPLSSGAFSLRAIGIGRAKAFKAF